MVKRKKHPDAPKGAMGAYMFFCKENREKVKQEHQGIDVRQILSELGRRWSSLADHDKKIYEDMAAEDKIRFEREKELFLQTHDSMFNEIAEKRKKRKKKKDPNAPKKNRSSYILFVNDNRQKAIAQLPPDAKQTEIMSLVATMWREAPQDIRAKYAQMAEAEKIDYQRRLDIYNSQRDEM
mmetsp:Transcript_119012/g.167283  ORF Transcript_119012/g.167283 Transcript_119012/m.167283 type:complete len:181 (-) Transcript_119012:161-703(-)